MLYLCHFEERKSGVTSANQLFVRLYSDTGIQCRNAQFALAFSLMLEE